jgi:hypothetical protein
MLPGVTLDGDVAIRPEAQDPHDQRIAGRRTLDVEGTDFTRPRSRNFRIVVIAGCRKRSGLNRRTGLDSQDRFANGKRLHAGLGFEFDGLTDGGCRAKAGGDGTMEPKL